MISTFVLKNGDTERKKRRASLVNVPRFKRDKNTIFAMNETDFKIMKRRDLLIHLLCWGIVLFVPLVFYRPTETWSIRMLHWTRSLGGTLSYMIIFYLNYGRLIPKYYFNHKSKTNFVLLNVTFITIALALAYGWWNVANTMFPDDFPHRRHGPHPPLVGILFQAVVIHVLVVGLSLAVRMAQLWQHSEQARKEAEQARSEAELSNLRNQLNPHFLLNTLNNIYALIAFAPEKAQGAVEELSKLLRHLLYENQQNFVPLYKEAAFMNNYIELMKIRVTQNVIIENNITIADDDATPIAPLIFISLIENAFKHGISPSGTGFIKVNVNKTENDTIVCQISNSNYPKRANDKSGSGIGLQQVQKRLDLIYPNRYTWEKGASSDGAEYVSTITIFNSSNS